MDIGALLVLAAPIIGLIWLGYLIFTKNLAEEGLGNILTYFIGVVIMFLAVGWLIDFFFFSWINERLEEAETSTEAVELRNRVRGIWQDATDDEEAVPVIEQRPGPAATPTPVIIVLTPTPGPGGQSAAPETPRTAPSAYTVQPGDTLVDIASRYEGVTFQDIMRANNLFSTVIYPGQELTIPLPAE